MNIQKSKIAPLCALALVLLNAPTAKADIGYQFVTVGNPGDGSPSNNDTTGLGGVTYVYDIGKYDVTLNQYTTFLNAVASSDPYGLYNPFMGTDANILGIARSGSAGSYSYSVIGDGQRPVTYVNWFDAARFSNWLQNGQPTGLGEVAGSTERGAYTLNGATSGVIAKNAGALYWIPTINEWYKAAYYDPTLNSGGGGYWKFATRSNTAPGNIIGGSLNQANYYNGVYSVSQGSTYSTSQQYLTDVGAFSNSASYYGTLDQSGNVWQWVDSFTTGPTEYVEGGAWANQASAIQSSFNDQQQNTNENFSIGFRLATVPEPSMAASLIVGSGIMLSRRKRKN